MTPRALSYSTRAYLDAAEIIAAGQAHEVLTGALARLDEVNEEDLREEIAGLEKDLAEAEAERRTYKHKYDDARNTIYMLTDDLARERERAERAEKDRDALRAALDKAHEELARMREATAKKPARKARKTSKEG